MAACVNASPDGKFRRGRPGAGPRGDFNLVRRPRERDGARWKEWCLRSGKVDAVVERKETGAYISAQVRRRLW